MSDDRLNGPMLSNIHREIKIVEEEILNKLYTKHPKIFKTKLR
jgi:hypothetical protein